MANMGKAEITLADLPEMQRFITAAAAVSAALADCHDLPEQVRATADELCAALTGLGVSVDEPPDPYRDPAVEDRIRDAMTEAMNHPGRTVIR